MENFFLQYGINGMNGVVKGDTYGTMASNDGYHCRVHIIYRKTNMSVHILKKNNGYMYRD